MKKKCSLCKKEIQGENKIYLPFCSERCKLVDLGKWATGDYRIPAEKADLDSQEKEEDDENVE